MIYLDSSAVLKLLVEEQESAALASWLASHPTVPVVSSELAKLEVVRSARRLDTVLVPAARTLVSQLDLVPLTSSVLSSAEDVGDALLRSLDAIHLASALLLADELTAFVAYDLRLVAAATSAGLPVVRPGQDDQATPPAGRAKPRYLQRGSRPPPSARREGTR